MTKSNNEKGFTIAELVIIVAVLAVLTAVFIPAFSHLVDTARDADGIAWCKNINTALVNDELTQGKPRLPSVAIKGVFDDGFTLESLNKMTRHNHVVYDFLNNRFALLKKDFSLLYGETDLGKILYLLVGDQNTVQNVLPDDEYRVIYCVITDNELVVDGSFDATLVDNCNVTLDTDDERCFIFTNNGKITVSAPYSTVVHHGSADEVNIDSVSRNSYVLKGKVKSLSLNTGHVVVDFSSEIELLHLHENADSCSVSVRSSLNEGKRGKIKQIHINTLSQWIDVKDEQGERVDVIVYCKDVSAEKVTLLSDGYEAVVVNYEGKVTRYTDVNQLMKQGLNSRDTVFLFRTPTFNRELPLAYNHPFTVYLADGVSLGSLVIQTADGSDILEKDLQPPDGFVSAKEYIAVKRPVAKVIKPNGTETGYDKYNNARDNVTDGDTLVLLADVSLGNVANPKKTCTIDLNGHVLFSSYKQGTISTEKGVTVTIKDSGEGGVLKNKSYAVISTEGNVIIESGTIDGTVRGNVKINGGVIKGKTEGNVTVAGGVFYENPESYLDENYVAIKRDGCWFVCKKDD